VPDPDYSEGWFVLAIRLVGVFTLIGMAATLGAIGYGIWWLIS
jgi:hypothetical protein